MNNITGTVSIVLCATLVSACDFSDNIPAGLEIEREISSDSTTFPRLHRSRCQNYRASYAAVYP